MDEMARQISGTGSATIDLSTLVYNDFIYCEVLDFHIKATVLHDLVNLNHKTLSADDIIQTLKKKFRSLKAQGLWSPVECKKVNMEVELYGLELTTNNMVEYHKRGQTGGNCQFQDVKVQYLNSINCFRCHKKGHFSDKCPFAKNVEKISVNEENLATSGYDSATAYS